MNLQRSYMKTKQKLINKTRTVDDNSLLENAHEIAKSLYKVGAIHAKTMREFDMRCMAKVKEFSPAQIKALRLRERVS